MFRHLFKLIWNKKKQNTLLIVEMLASFIVIFAVFTLLIYFYQNYKKPLGFDYENVWAARFTHPDNIHNKDSLILLYETVDHMLHSMPQIKHASFASGNYPFSFNTNNSLFKYKNKGAMSNFYVVRDDYANVLNLKMAEGRWFNKTDNAGIGKPVVINESLKEELFNEENAVGKIFGEGTDKMKVIGVVHDFKSKGDFMPISNGLFERMDTASAYWLVNAILINVQPNTGADFEGKLFKSLSNAIGSTIEIVHLTTQRQAINSTTMVPVIILVVVAGFLIVNVALGIFGVLWYNISKRKAEIGLRRAVGASGNSILRQLVGEAMVLSTIALVIGSFFALQFPLLNVFDLPASVYIIALLLSIAFIYLLVVICAFYPGRQAAGIYPAVALHED